MMGCNIIGLSRFGWHDFVAFKNITYIKEKSVLIAELRIDVRIVRMSRLGIQSVIRTFEVV